VKKIKIQISKVDKNNNDLPLPVYSTKGSSGMDIRAVPEKDIVIKSGETALVPTGIQISIPAGFEGQIRPRSGLALNHGIMVLNSPGTIDSDYRGEIKIILANFGKVDFRVSRGDRIAQLVITSIVHADWLEVDTLEKTGRDAGGFGHTGR
jgi:dUTP pyrophosphatase